MPGADVQGLMWPQGYLYGDDECRPPAATCVSPP